MSDKLRLSTLINEGYAARTENKWPTYTGGYLDRRKHVSSSETGGCARKIKFSKAAKPRPFERWGFAERGHMIEDWAVNLIRGALEIDKEWKLLYAVPNQMSFILDKQSGTPDGLLVNAIDDFAVGIEVKSIDPRTNYNNLPRDKDVTQTQQNMDLMTRLTPYTVTNALLIYIDASDLQKRREFVLSADEAEQQRLKHRADWIMSTPASEIPPEGINIDKACDQCDFVDECNALIRELKEMQVNERVMKHVFSI